MIDHIVFRVKDISRAKEFYTPLLEVIGYSLAFDSKIGESSVLGFSKAGKMEIWISDEKPSSGPFHIAWRVESKDLVDKFHEKALSLGGRDNGRPGPREYYSPDYYGGFILDLDGNNIEAMYRDDKQT